MARRAEFTTRLRAVLELYGDRGAMAYGSSALQVLGVALPTRLEDFQVCHIVVPTGGHRRRRHDVVAHHFDHTKAAWKTVSGIAVPHPVDCWVQLQGATRDELIEVGDGFLRRTRPLLSGQELASRLDQLTGAPGVKRVRAALGGIVPDTDSLYETRTRLLLVNAGLPCPVVNHPVWCASTGILYHLDRAYVDEQVAIEYDGVDHVATRTQMDIDADRRRNLQDEGWLVITVTSAHLRRPEGVIRSVEQALILRRARGAQPRTLGSRQPALNGHAQFGHGEWWDQPM